MKEIILLALMSFLSACSATLSTDEINTHLSSSNFTVDNVILDQKLLSLEDSASHMGTTVTVPTWFMIKKRFTCQNNCPNSLTLTSSRLTFETRDEFPLPIFHSSSNYRLTCILETNNQRIPVSGTGTGKSGINTEKAIIQAIDTALEDLAIEISRSIKNFRTVNN